MPAHEKAPHVAGLAERCLNFRLGGAGWQRLYSLHDQHSLFDCQINIRCKVKPICGCIQLVSYEKVLAP